MANDLSVGGLISGLNTSDIVSKLMQLERQPLVQLQQKTAKEQAKLAAVEAIKAAVSSLQGAFSTLALRSSTNAKTATTDTASGAPTVLTATAGADAINGSFKVTVNQLATATNVLSADGLGAAIDRLAKLGSAGFRITPVTTAGGNPATFSINGQTISVDDNTTLDDGTANSLIAKINAAGAGVTASLIADANGHASNRFQLVSDAGKTIQLGAGADTSNLLRVLNVADAAVQGYTAASVTGGGVAAGALNTSLTINGVTTVINQTDGSFTGQQNAAFIASAINANAAGAVQVIDNGDGTLTLRQKTLGSQSAVDVTSAGAETGFAVGKTQNGTDRVVGTAALGVVDTGAAITASRLLTPIAGLDASGSGKFAINGVDISFKGSDSISTILNRINASSAGVSAFYDPIQDRIRLSSSQTGARTITLEDKTGNFLQATGLLNATQTLGKNALFSIDTVNGGQPLSSSSNTISGYIPGVTLELKSASANPVTVTVNQDTATTVSTVKSFVDKFNAVLDAIDQQTKYDPDNKQASTLTGDSSVLQIQRTLLQLVGDTALGATGAYRSLASIGISTGPVGTVVGGSYRLQLDQGKLTAALKDNPQAVTNLFAGFSATLGAPTGSANIAAVSGTPLNQHEDGTYYVKVLDASNKVQVRFVTAGGRTLLNTTTTLKPGADNLTVVPGLKVTAAAALTVGEEASFSLKVDTRGVAVKAKDYLSSLMAPDGFFASRESSSQSITKALNDRINDMNERLKLREDNLNRQFNALETTMARLQTQSAALSGAITQMNAQLR